MMKILFSTYFTAVFCIFCSSLTSSCTEKETHPILDGIERPLPKKFRTMQDPFADPSYTVEEGLRNLPFSGSGQYFEDNLLAGLTLIKQIAPDHQIILVDLREESHGFINGIPMSWTNGETNDANLHKTVEEIEEDERFKLEELVKQGIITVSLKDDKGTQTIVMNSARTERELIESLGLTYFRMPITDHIRPSDQFVDQFVSFIRHLPKDAWVHFHCKGGSGRTTTILTMCDMIQNTSKVSLDDYFIRQYLLGGKDLRELDKNSFKFEVSKERLAFIQQFYTYCCQEPDFQISWSEWYNTKKNN